MNPLNVIATFGCLFCVVLVSRFTFVYRFITIVFAEFNSYEYFVSFIVYVLLATVCVNFL